MNLSILGSTGSIGTQTLDVARKCGFKVSALCANKSVKTLEEQIREFSPEIAVLSDENAAKELKIKVADTSTKVLSGSDSVLQVASHKNADTVVNSFVGMAGLMPTLCAIDEGKTIASSLKVLPVCSITRRSVCLSERWSISARSASFTSCE